MAKTRILFAGLFHEPHCFVDDITWIDRFRIRRDAVIMARRGDRSQVDEFFGVAEREGRAAVAHRQASEKSCRKHTQSPRAAVHIRFSCFPYTSLRRPVFPLDPF